MNWLRKQFGANIKALRKKAGYNQGEFGQLLDLSRVSVMNIESGRHMPTLEGFYTICCVLGCTYDALLPKPQKVSIKTKERTVIKKKIVRELKPVKVI
jgi:DNA-binding XRE family transcriptional regulator